MAATARGESGDRRPNSTSAESCGAGLMAPACTMPLADGLAWRQADAKPGASGDGHDRRMPTHPRSVSLCARIAAVGIVTLLLGALVAGSPAGAAGPDGDGRGPRPVRLQSRPGDQATTRLTGSLVYVNPDGQIMVSSPDGITVRRLTPDGGYRHPSQALDGTIVATKDGQLYHFDRV